jgi:hypothetical protein
MFRAGELLIVPEEWGGRLLRNTGTRPQNNTYRILEACDVWIVCLKTWSHATDRHFEQFHYHMSDALVGSV